MSSVEEAGGLPMMEAAASGRLPIGTPVGYFETNGPKGGGIVVPINEKEFVKNTHYTLCLFRDNPILFRHSCEESQNFARENYDWSFVIDEWVSLLTH
jgi:glycosyltransferase involved in cell wall biosynthesis